MKKLGGLDWITVLLVAAILVVSALIVLVIIANTSTDLTTFIPSRMTEVRTCTGTAFNWWGIGLFILAWLLIAAILAGVLASREDESDEMWDRWDGVGHD